MAASDHDNRVLSLISRTRQVRVAYLIDPAFTPFEMLDAIFSTCSHVWGGRLSPIIPVIDGEISSAYWRVSGVMGWAPPVGRVLPRTAPTLNAVRFWLEISSGLSWR